MHADKKQIRGKEGCSERRRVAKDTGGGQGEIGQWVMIGLDVGLREEKRNQNSNEMQNWEWGTGKESEGVVKRLA